jgi:ribosomal protein S18 acetylase RimI-like enzyme
VAGVNDPGARACAPGEARRLEEFCFNVLQSRRQLLYDGWLLFLSPGTAKRARSVNAHFGSSLPLEAKIAHCEALYARHGLSTLFRMTPCTQPDGLDDALAARGYIAFDRTLVQTCALADALPFASAAVAPEGVALSSPLPEAFVEAVGEMRGSAATQRTAHLERLAQSPLTLIPILVRRDGATVASGMACVDGGLAGIFDVVTAPAERRSGLGTLVVCALLVRAWERGAYEGFLQVDESNHAALSIYRRFGFATRYAYHYRARAGEVE